MDNDGEDSGLEFPDNNLIDDFNQQQLDFGLPQQEIDEGIVLDGNQSINQQQFIPQQQLQQAQDIIDPAMFQIEGQDFVFVADQNDGLNFANPVDNLLLPPPDNFMNQNQPPYIQHEQQQHGQGQQEQVIVAGAVGGLALDIDLGDDNNNDRPDDFNNNTTDPEMQMRQLQIQQQQLGRMRQQLDQINQRHVQIQEMNEQQLLQQQQDDNDIPTSIVNVALTETEFPPIILENGKMKDKKDKKDKRKKKKKKKRNRLVVDFKDENINKDGKENGVDENDEPDNVEIEYVPEKLELSVFDPMYKAFANVFENFRISDLGARGKQADEDTKPKAEDLAKALSKVPKVEDDDDDEKKEEEKPKISKRKLKQLTRLSIAELKQVVVRPDVVEMHDITAHDPKLLVHLKAYRNTVPVPRHWCYKRKYLQGKRGIEKPPFDLPGFIKKTGIMEMRAAIAEKEEIKTLKSKMREKIRPKMGKIDIDYQKLHDAFFKWQSKPKMSIHGDLYYEGKEFETRMKDKKPGDLTDDLRTSLGMPVGPNSQRVPPPWLIAMQRYGPPPSYPHIKISGLNAPIPEGCSFGYHAGGWGKPPVDEFGRPLYGDVFGVVNSENGGHIEEEYIDKSLWGELESEEEVESEEEEEEEDDEAKKDEEGNEKVEESGLQTPAEGLQTPSGFSSVPAGLETPELIELRKRRIEQDMEGGDTPSLFTVLPEKRVDRIAGSMMASTHIYDINAALKEKSRGDASGRIELALDPSELDLDSEAMTAKYEQTIKERNAANAGEDLSDMVAEHAAKQKTKRKRQMEKQDPKQQQASSSKKHKEFKF